MRSGVVLASFIGGIAVTASSPTNRVLAHDSGGRRVEEKTTFDSSAIRAKVGSASWATISDMVR